VNKEQLSSWEERLNNASVNVLSFTDAQSSSACNAWRAYIETTLLADLSKEERSSLVEHVKSCSACAERFRKYQIIEEFAGELPHYDLLLYDKTRTDRPQRRGQKRLCRTKERRWNISRTIRTLVTFIVVLTVTLGQMVVATLVAPIALYRRRRGY